LEKVHYRWKGNTEGGKLDKKMCIKQGETISKEKQSAKRMSTQGRGDNKGHLWLADEVAKNEL